MASSTSVVTINTGTPMKIARRNGPRERAHQQADAERLHREEGVAMVAAVGEVVTGNDDVARLRLLRELRAHFSEQVMAQHARIEFKDMACRNQLVAGDVAGEFPGAAAAGSAGSTCHFGRHCTPPLAKARGSVICPVMAEAATVMALARKISASLLPMRPGSLRVLVLMRRSPAVSCAIPPKHGPQVDGEILAPAAVSSVSNPSCKACWKTCWVAGITSRLTSACTL